MKNIGKAVSVSKVSEYLLDYLHRTYGPHRNFRIAHAHPVRLMPWSSIYFLDVVQTHLQKTYVVKIPGFPDQTVPDTSWQSKELLIRGQREYSSIIRVYNHFAAQENRKLRALRPETYLVPLNAVVMNFIPDGTLYDTTVSPRQLVSPNGYQSALERLRRTGEWLGWLHRLPAENTSPAKKFNVAHAYSVLLQEAERVSTRTPRFQKLAQWQPVLKLLGQIPDQEGVWIHNDYHMRNVLVAPDGTILGLDTVLDALDNPCADLAKLIVDLRTRRWQILSQGLFPPKRLIDHLVQSFLEGYAVTGRTFSPLTLALYEGQYLLEKWNQCHIAVSNGLGTTYEPLAPPISRTLVDPVLGRLVQEWMNRVLRLAS